MKALVFGARGQVGRALLTLVPDRVEAVPVTRDDVDICDAEAVQRFVERAGPAIIVNAAAYTAVDKAEQDEAAAIAVNRDAAANLAKAAAAAGARFVHISTDFVFDGTQGTPYLPQAQVNPQGAYGRSKAEGEAAVRRASPDALIVRTAWVYAAGTSNFVETMLRLMASRPSLGVVADQIGTPTHAYSLASALWTLAETGVSGTHHFTDAGVASWYDFAVAIQDMGLAAGLLADRIPIAPIATADYPTPARRPAYSVLDKTSAWRALGGPARHWREELKRMFDEKMSMPDNG